MMSRKPSAVLRVFWVALVLVGSASPAWAMSVDERLEQLERLLGQQQEQLEAQSQLIEELQGRIEALQSPKDLHHPVATAEEDPPKTFAVRSGNRHVDVALYGQLNRGLLVVDDGDESSFYQVDNDHSSTRIGLRGRTEMLDGWSLATRFEVELESNATRTISQLERNGAGGRNFRERWLDVSLSSERYGTFSVGQGDTASNKTSEVDLSGTKVAGNADVANVAGGFYFYDKRAGELTQTRVKDVFNHFDGLSRDDRLRYDSPAWHGLTLAGSVVSGSGYDVALSYKGKLSRFKVASAIAYSDPGEDRKESPTVAETFNGSFSIRHETGLNLTMAGGVRDVEEAGHDDATFCYAKVGYRTRLLDVGDTAFSVDYGTFRDVARVGDDGRTFGLQLVQFVERWAAEFYLGYRSHRLDRPHEDFADLDAALSGVRVKF